MQKMEKDKLEIKIYETRKEMGEAAAKDAAECIKKLIKEKGNIRMIFAAAPSQNEFLEALISDNEIDWSKIDAFHMDEYVGLDADAPQGFGNFLDRAIFSRVPFKSVSYINGQQDPDKTCAEYTEKINAAPVDIVCMGVGENGHIAFNDPPVADFNDKAVIKKVRLDEICRNQQVNDGCFAKIDDVPQYALTLTVPTLMACEHVFCVVPAATKAQAIYDMLNGEIGESCPATALRKHDRARLYLDGDSSGLLKKVCPMKIAIITKYTEMPVHYNRWANEENYINWRKDFYEGTRCTVAFAATELKSFLGAVIPDAEIYYSSAATGDTNIYLEAENEQGRSGIYALIPCENGVKIVGRDRVGVLYGVYELLKLQGYRWLSPDTAGGTVTPDKTDKIILPETEQHFSPKMDLWRGFDFEGHLPGNHMWLYMARNRLNGVRPQAGCVGMQNKLGMIFKDGGHFFHSIIAPDSVLPDGTTVWESHREWYGVRTDGKAVTQQNAMETQFCVSNDEVCKYFADEVVRRLKNEWKHADRLDIWGFDTWGSTCCCEDCKALGNSTDQTLHLLSKLREGIDNSDLDRKVELVICSYGGTCTLEPPTNPIPQNIIDAGDIMVFYPITRCYRHHLDEKPCYENEYFERCLEGWLNKEPAMPVIMGEYYDCSKFEEIPAVLSDVMCYDIPKWCEMGIKGITYMHVPVANWGVKALTQWLYSNLSFDPSLDKEDLLNDYFNHRYNKNAGAMKKVYANLQTAFRIFRHGALGRPKACFHSSRYGMEQFPQDRL